MSENTNLPARINEVAADLLYKLRLNKLDPTSRELQKHGVVNKDGFLTIAGAQVFLDYLWQKHPEAQKEIAGDVKKLNKKGKRDED